MKLSDLWSDIELAAREGGALRVGASDLEDTHVGTFLEWLGRGHEAEMHYLRKNGEVRANPADRFPWARSVVSIIVPYSPERPEAPAGAISHHIARYALGDDYHDVLDGILRVVEQTIARADPESRTWRYVDTGPLSDRAYAAQGGLGWIGKNGMLIDENIGSYFFIGTLLTSLDNDIGAEVVADRCGRCVKCLEACPTDAILDDRTLDSERCISYQTIEHRGPVPEWIKPYFEGNAFGCDLCQEVCPWNRFAPPGHAAFHAREAYRATPITDLLQFDQESFSALFRKSAVKRARRNGMIRNVLISREPSPAGSACAANEEDEGILDALDWRQSAAR